MELKRCSKCKEWKPLEAFGKCKSNKDGLQYRCKACRKAYRDANKDLINKKGRDYWKNNKDILSNKKKLYYKKNKAVLDRKKRKNYYDNVKHYSEYNKQYCENNRAILLKKKKSYNYSDAKYSTYKNKLTIDEAPKLSKDGVSLEVKCRYCGRYFIPNNIDVRQRVQSLKGHTGGDCFLYCSISCKSACPIYRKIKYPKGYKKATSREVQPELRQLVLERDNWTCQKCGKTVDEVEIHCHHVLPINESPIESADKDNCITLCRACHKEVHRLPDCGYNDLKCSKGL